MLVLRGEEANLRLVAEEIAEHPELEKACAVRITPAAGRRPGAMGHGVLAEIAVSVTSGVLTAALTDALRLIVARARDRGDVEEGGEKTSSPRKPDGH